MKRQTINSAMRDATIALGHNLADAAQTVIDRSVSAAVVVLTRAPASRLTTTAEVRSVARLAAEAGLDKAATFYQHYALAAVRIVPAVVRLAGVSRVREDITTTALGDMLFDRFSQEDARRLTKRAMSATDYRGARARLTERAARTAAKTLADGLAEGVPYREIKERLIDSLGDRKGIGWDRLIETELARVSNLAFAEYVERNRDIMDGVQWTAALDTHTCPICAAMDGQTFWFKPGAGEKAYRGAARPPLHPRCRCRTIPIVKPADRLPINPESITDELRRECDGAPAARVSYAEWFAGLASETQRAILGPGRFAEFAAGRPVTQFAAGRSLLTIGELAQSGPAVVSVAPIVPKSLEASATAVADALTGPGESAAIGQRFSPLLRGPGAQLTLPPGQTGGELPQGAKRYAGRLRGRGGPLAAPDGSRPITVVSRAGGSAEDAVQLARSTTWPWPAVVTRGVKIDWPRAYMLVSRARGGYVQTLSAVRSAGAVTVRVHPAYYRLLTDRGRKALTAAESRAVAALMDAPASGAVPVARFGRSVGWRTPSSDALTWAPIP